MGKIDSAAKECFSDNTRFADLCNAVLFEGEQVVCPDQLVEKDSTEVLSILGKNSQSVHVQKWRDLLKSAIVKINNNVCFVLIGVEAQATVHYAMPVRHMIYDALDYGKQVKEVARKHKREKDTESADEFLSGFTARDKIIPIITITVYLGSKTWDAPRCLTEMYMPVDERIKPYLQDYNANIFIPGEFDNFDKFQTDLKQIFEVVSVAGDKSKMNQILSEDEKFKHMDNETVRTINIIAGTRIRLNEKGQVVDMCKAWEEQYEDGRAKGLTQGREEEIFQSVSEGDYGISRGAEKLGISEQEFVERMKAAGF